MTLEGSVWEGTSKGEVDLHRNGRGRVRKLRTFGYLMFRVRIGNQGFPAEEGLSEGGKVRSLRTFVLYRKLFC
jgi:hypothetical protein